MSVPAPAVPVIVKALGAYMRAAPALDLPPEVRRLRNFHQKMLMTHSTEIVAMLEDEAVRGLVLQWLDDAAPGLPKAQEQALRLAAGRPDRWEEELSVVAGAGRPAAAKTEPSDALRHALRKEAGKTAAAKEEARRVKESSRKSLEEERATVKELRKEVEALRRDAASSAAAASEAREDASRSRAELDKVERKARKDVAAAKAAKQEAAAQLRAVRKELSAARRRIAELEESLEKATRPQPKRAPEEPPRGPRRPLRVPPGRLADDPLTLDAWLDAPGVHLLVDGYNVTKQPEGFPDLDLPSQRDRLLEALEKLTLKKKVPTTVVFDGSDVGPGKSRLGRARVRVEYSRSGETADDHLIAKLTSLPPDPVVLVTSDKELQERAAAEGATIGVSAQLLELTR